MDDFFVADGGVRDRVFHSGQLKSERKLKGAQDGLSTCFHLQVVRGKEKRTVQFGILQGDFFFCLSAKSRWTRPSRDTANQLRPTRKAVIAQGESCRCCVCLHFPCKLIIY